LSDIHYVYSLWVHWKQGDDLAQYLSHHISLGGDKETLELAVKERLISKDEIDIYYD